MRNLVASNILDDQVLSLGFPLGAVVFGVVQKLVARDPKDTALVQLFGQRDDVLVEEVEFGIEPKRGRILGQASLLVGIGHFLKESLVPFDKDVPMLHGVSHVAGLDQMIQHDHDPKIVHVVGIRWIFDRSPAEDLLPACISVFLEILVENVRRQHRVGDELFESFEVHCGRAQALDELRVIRQHQSLPREVDGMVLGRRLSVVFDGHPIVFFDQL